MPHQPIFDKKTEHSNFKSLPRVQDVPWVPKQGNLDLYICSSKGIELDTPPSGPNFTSPLGFKFFHFDAVFDKIICKIIVFASWRPHFRKILDPPLPFCGCSQIIYNFKVLDRRSQSAPHPSRTVKPTNFNWAIITSVKHFFVK